MCQHIIGMAGMLCQDKGFDLFVYTLGTYLLTTRLFPALERSSQPQVLSLYAS